MHNRWLPKTLRLFSVLSIIAGVVAIRLERGGADDVFALVAMALGAVFGLQIAAVALDVLMDIRDALARRPE